MNDEYMNDYAYDDDDDDDICILKYYLNAKRILAVAKNYYINSNYDYAVLL